jgi:hypothetical protein
MTPHDVSLAEYGFITLGVVVASFVMGALAEWSRSRDR